MSTTVSPSITAPTTATTTTANRLAALDWMRGLVMMLMVIDHAKMWNPAAPPASDSWLFYVPGTMLDLSHFFTRWVTHLCAPTFLFLAGTALALSVERRRVKGASPGTLDRYLLIRGLIIIGIELTWWIPFVLQVLYAIGMSLICMIPLRRLSTRTLVVAALAFMAVGEFINITLIDLSGHEPATAKEMLWDVSEIEEMMGREATGEALVDTPPGGSLGWLKVTLPFFMTGVLFKLGSIPFVLMYPFVPWLAIMMLGWAFGRYLIRWQESSSAPVWQPDRILFIWGLVGLAVFVVVRGLNGYGNMFLLRQDGSLIQWLNVSKYPPSLTFFALEMGIMAICLAGFFRFQAARENPPRLNNPFLVFGQTALFFYLLHMHIMMLANGIMTVIGVSTDFELPGVYVATIIDLIVMYPICKWYRGYKTAHRDSWVRYI